MINKFEEIKHLGNYAINFNFGEGIGCDDIDIPTDERNVRMICTPVGFTGQGRMMWYGKLKDFLTFDFSSQAKVISNPPEEHEYRDGGYFIWGTQEAIELYQKKFEAKS